MSARTLAFAALVGSICLPLAAALPQTQSWTDDFNRPNGALGGDWTMQNGTFLISNNTAYSTGGDHHWALHNLAAASYANQRVSVDFLPRVQGPPLFYVGLALGALPSWESIFIKVQDNNGDSLYDRVFFWSAVNAGASWATPSNFNLAVPTASGRMTCYFTGNGDVANLDIDRDFNGTVDEHFELAGLLNANLNLAMAPPLTADGQVTYGDGTKSTVDQMAKDVAAFLVWTAEPKLEKRKQVGWPVLGFLLFASVLAYLAYRNVWASVKH